MKLKYVTMKNFLTTCFCAIVLAQFQAFASSDKEPRTKITYIGNEDPSKAPVMNFEVKVPVANGIRLTAQNIVSYPDLQKYSHLTSAQAIQAFYERGLKNLIMDIKVDRKTMLSPEIRDCEKTLSPEKYDELAIGYIFVNHQNLISDIGWSITKQDATRLSMRSIKTVQINLFVHGNKPIKEFSHLFGGETGWVPLPSQITIETSSLRRNYHIDGIDWERIGKGGIDIDDKLIDSIQSEHQRSEEQLAATYAKQQEEKAKEDEKEWLPESTKKFMKKPKKGKSKTQQAGPHSPPNEQLKKAGSPSGPKTQSQKTGKHSKPQPKKHKKK